ncbi:MAG: argininosuccinate lyase [Sulfurimonas sp. RIFCSPHIGHO2_12_FULL_36_9]|uniref:argininosuccinate lyase n=1 Tax=Sulfurimonas sp. RIFCSPLOWO2_12_36_12 TaxID=1802253 RepID=UPI0008B96594|nr:argininosuccinate lyase [Sulfurimonas sp. RIFCSPLOWO2_12_36_12]OHD98786.1 MAG: argininosuccinate lyase [Sulfurimonas sp. RIFCSPHIGHO2_12_FULL_36_9]OHE01017.1 MAG: argininosuccinate lyase [Sulfurimonas sp. RIFCSPLOWO2_02_FULL_36_28]OHE01442.1 MAG: argininosuccinate lyase [Sulfurimonas sp. RIFCSPLOWO2_12_FULL_36_74]OHE01563.1 MAG: argininosuccinate lyase [Sulfurimonas sp. RIFCSPLOWO2_12_36_12]
MDKMWSGRFSASASSLLDQFNASIMFDRKLYREDIEGSIAHAKMLTKQGILTTSELTQITDGLNQVKNEIESGEFEWKISDEDLHMGIEKRLTAIIGEAGKKLHTARSRNDQVAVDFRRYVLRKNLEIVSALKLLMREIHIVASKHTETLVPGMTHLQHAQPINFAFHLSAYLSMFKRDIERFESSCERNNVSPLGCAALAGTPHKIDRDMTAELLGFSSVSVNCLDTVSDRDFALEILFNISTMMMHISRLSEELVMWSSYEFRFVELSDEYSTGSSIMPQKKNPDVPELLRGKTGRVYGSLMGLLTVMKGLPLAYNKDTQEDKEGVFDAVETAEISLAILKEAIKTMQVKTQNMQNACKMGHLSATDLADYLVQKCNIPFREAHFITGKAVAKSEELKIDLSDIELKYLQEIDSRIGEDVLKFLSIENSMNARTSEGGTSTQRTQEQLQYFKNFLEK